MINDIGLDTRNYKITCDSQVNSLGQGFNTMLNLENKKMSQPEIELVLNKIIADNKVSSLKSVVLTGNSCSTLPANSEQLIALERIFINGNNVKNLFGSEEDGLILEELQKIDVGAKTKKDCKEEYLKRTKVDSIISNKVIFLIQLKSIDATFNVHLTDNAKEILKILSKVGVIADYSKTGEELNKALGWTSPIR
jgi:small nuclear ribonucleoprotein (snRNP)-like protein